jgi:adenylosuccinate synthase
MDQRVKERLPLNMLVCETRTLLLEWGGPNSGHTAYDSLGQRYIFRHLPTAAILGSTLCVIGAGSYIDPSVLKNEINAAELPKDRLMIDPMAVVIEREHINAEKRRRMNLEIGSTETGTGAALISRVARSPNVVLAKDHAYLRQFTNNGHVFSTLRYILDAGDRVGSTPISRTHP